MSALVKQAVRIQLDFTVEIRQELTEKQIRGIVNDMACRAGGNRRFDLHEIQFLCENGAAWQSAIYPGQKQAPSFGGAWGLVEGSK